MGPRNWLDCGDRGTFVQYTGSELGFSRRTGKPLGDGVTRALAIHTANFFVCFCSKIQVCGVSRHSGLCAYASTSNSLDGGILTVSTRYTVRGEVGVEEVAVTTGGLVGADRFVEYACPCRGHISWPGGNPSHERDT